MVGVRTAHRGQGRRGSGGRPAVEAVTARCCLRVVLFVSAHLLLSGVVAAAFVRQFAQGWLAIATHIVVLAEWDALLLVVLGTIAALQPRHRIGWACRLLPAATFACQIYLYALNVVSNVFWGRNITGHLVAAFAPTVWSGQEPFPVGAAGIALFVFGTMALMTAASRWWGPALDAGLRSWLQDARGAGRARRRFSFGLAVAAIGSAAIFAATMVWGVQTDSLLWKSELIVSFFRPNGFAFEPTPRRRAVAERDAILRAAYPRHVAAARSKHVVLIIVDSLRADHMQVYGYQRRTTPFLSSLVQSGRMKRVGAAFSTCSESFCGITSTLSGREFRNISARDFQIQDVLRDQGYQTWFLLSGNHRVWNGLPQFYHADDGTFFDGSQTQRYTTVSCSKGLSTCRRPPATGRPSSICI
jgi:sulfatase-like protein